MKILIVDDSKKHRQAAKEQLESLGHEVQTVNSYFKAIRLCREQKFDLALIDLLMPAEADTLGEAGLEFLGQNIMVGYPLAIILAAAGMDVAVVTDMNHHHHPASAVMDYLLGETYTINGRQVQFHHARLKENGTKDWAVSLEELISKKTA